MKEFDPKFNKFARYNMEFWAKVQADLSDALNGNNVSPAEREAFVKNYGEAFEEIYNPITMTQLRQYLYDPRGYNGKDREVIQGFVENVQNTQNVKKYVSDTASLLTEYEAQEAQKAKAAEKEAEQRKLIVDDIVSDFQTGLYNPILQESKIGEVLNKLSTNNIEMKEVEGRFKEAFNKLDDDQKIEFKMNLYKVSKEVPLDQKSRAQEMNGALYGLYRDAEVGSDLKGFINKQVQPRKALKLEPAAIANEVLSDCSFDLLDKLGNDKAFQKSAGTTFKEKFGHFVHSISSSRFQDTEKSYAIKHAIKDQSKTWVEKAEAQKQEDAKGKGGRGQA